MNHEDFTSFVIMTPPAFPNDFRHNGYTGQYGRYNAYGEPDYNISNMECGITGEDATTVNFTEAVKQVFYGTSKPDIAVGDYITYDHDGSVFRGIVTSITDYGSGDGLRRTLHVTKWTTGTWSGNETGTERLIVGGSLASLNDTTGWNAWCESTFVNSDSKPPCLWIQTGNTFTDAVTFANDGTASSPLSVRGYDTTPGDTLDEDDRPSITVAAASSSALTLTNRQYLHFADLIFEHTNASNGSQVVRAFGSNNRTLTFERCKIASASTCSGAGIIGLRGYGLHRLVGCEIVGKNTGSFMVNVLVGNVLFSACKFKNCGYSIYCFMLGNTSMATFDQCVFDGLLNDGPVFALTGKPTGLCVKNCVFDGMADGVALIDGTQNVNYPYFQNCVFIPYAGTTLFPDGRAVHVHNCATYGTLGTVIGDDNIELSGDPFIDRANGDYRINTASAAGRQLLNAGYPSSLPGLLSSTSYSDIGACQQRPVLLEPIA